MHDADKAAEIALGLTEAQRDVLRAYTPATYAINFPQGRVQQLVDVGMLEWTPPVWGNENNWSITPLGSAVAEILKAEKAQEPS